MIVPDAARLLALEAAVDDLTQRLAAAELGREPIYLADRPLDQVCMDGQLDLWNERTISPCLYEL